MQDPKVVRLSNSDNDYYMRDGKLVKMPVIPYVHITDGCTDEERQEIMDRQKTLVARHIVARGPRPSETDGRKRIGQACMTYDEAIAWLEKVG